MTGRKNVYIYAPTKTGTTSVKDALEEAGAKTVRVNYLAAESVQLEMDTIRMYQPVGMEQHGPYVDTIRDHLKYADEIKTADYIITLVRNPVKRQISRFFHTVGHFFKEQTPTIEKLNDKLYEMSIYQNNLYLNYHDREFTRLLGIDIFTKPLVDGWGIFKDRVLVIRTEDLTRIGAKAIKEFTGLDVAIERKRPAEGEKYAGLHKGFLGQFKAKEAWLDEIYKSTFYTHFYGKQR